MLHVKYLTKDNFSLWNIIFSEDGWHIYISHSAYFTLTSYSMILALLHQEMGPVLLPFETG